MNFNASNAFDSINARQDAIHAQRDSLKKTNELVNQDRVIAQTNQNNQILAAGNAMLAQENQKYKDILARPLGEILDENANLKKAVEEQKALIALWILRQRAMKKVAFDLAQNKGVSEDEIMQDAEKNMHKVLIQSDNLEIIPDSNMEYFENHKNYLINNYK